MFSFMVLIFLFAGKYTNYKTECSSHHAENTFLCMRLTPRGLTPSMKEMDDRYKDEKSHNKKGSKVAMFLMTTQTFPVFPWIEFGILRSLLISIVTFRSIRGYLLITIALASLSGSIEGYVGIDCL